MAYFQGDPSKWSAFELAQVAKQIAKSVEQVTARMPDDEHAKWLQRLEALDNLLALFGLKRHADVFGGGFLIYHPSDALITGWISADASEESWLEDVKKF